MGLFSNPPSTTTAHPPATTTEAPTTTEDAANQPSKFDRAIMDEIDQLKQAIGMTPKQEKEPPSPANEPEYDRAHTPTCYCPFCLMKPSAEDETNE